MSHTLDAGAEQSAQRHTDPAARSDAVVTPAAGPALAGPVPRAGGRFGAMSGAAMLGLQRSAGNRAVSSFAVGASPRVHRHVDTPVPHPHHPHRVQRAATVGEGADLRLGAVQRMSDADVVQRLGLDFLADLGGGLMGGSEAEELSGGGAASCTEKPTIKPASSVPVTINADSALDFVQKMKSALGNPHMAPSFSETPDTDDAGKITKVNLTLEYSIVRPRWGSGYKVPPEEVALIRKIEGLIKAHEERHAAIAKDYAQRAVCAAIGKTGATYKAAIEAQLCAMNKAQETLDKAEGTIAWTLNADGTKVVDASLAGWSGASYPCS